MLTVVGIAVIGVSALSYVVFGQLYDLADRLPKYEGNITAKAKAFQGDGHGVIAKMATAFDHLKDSLTTKTTNGRPKPGAPVPPISAAENNPLADAPITSPPVPVEIVEPVTVPGMFGRILGPLLAPMASAAIVVVFVIFILLEREDLRNRLIRLIGPRQLNFTTQALDAAANRVSRYLRMQLIINAIFGTIAALGLFLLGVPNPALWGVVAGLMRFIPFVGPIIGALVPLVISLAIFDDWWRPSLVLGLFVFDELVANNLLEPILYGATTGIAPLAVVGSMVFWMWLWGPVGLILAMPLTVCLTVMGSYVPRLEFLNTLLSDQDALSPAARFYQRLLALDMDEAIDIAEGFLKDNSLESLFDVVLVPALGLSETDRHHGDLEDSKQQFINQTVRELIEDLGARSLSASAGLPAEGSGPQATLAADDPVSVLCLPARDDADEIVGLMLVQLLGVRGIKARVLSSTLLASEMVGEVTEHLPGVVGISALPPFAATHARYLCKRLAPAIGSTPIIAGLWQPNDETTKADRKLAEIGISRRVSKVSEAAETIAKIVTSNNLLQCS